METVIFFSTGGWIRQWKFVCSSFGQHLRYLIGKTGPTFYLVTKRSPRGPSDCQNRKETDNLRRSFAFSGKTIIFCLVWLRNNLFNGFAVYLSPRKRYAVLALTFCACFWRKSALMWLSRWTDTSWRRTSAFWPPGVSTLPLCWVEIGWKNPEMLFHYR